MHMVAFLLPVLGTAWTSTSVSAVSVTAMLGRVSLGSVIDRLPCRPVSAVSFASQAGGLALMLVMPASPPALFAGCVLFGVSVGNVITLPAMIARAEFPAASFGVVIGLNGAIGQLTLAVVPVSFGLLHDAAGGYTPVLIVCIVLQAVAVRLVLRRSVPLPA